MLKVAMNSTSNTSVGTVEIKTQIILQGIAHSQFTTRVSNIIRFTINLTLEIT